MAVKIEFTGYVNRVREYDWGVVYDVAHNQMQKKGDRWETIGRDYFSVVGVEGGTRFAENDMVNIKGTLKTKTFDKQDGSKGIALNVRAEEMSKQATARDAKPKANPEAQLQDVWAEAQEVTFDNAPF